MTPEPVQGRRVAVAVSGGGRSLANFLKTPGEYEIAGVIASRPDCTGAAIARDAKLPLFIGDFSSTAHERTGRALEEFLAKHAISWVVLAGFLKLYPVSVAWRGRVVNIHPALLPKFGGRGMYGNRVHSAVIAAGESISGATVHFVDGRYDEGSIIAQVTVPVLATDDAQALADRVFAAECGMYPRVVSALVSGDLPLQNGQIEKTNAVDGRMKQGNG